MLERRKSNVAPLTLLLIILGFTNICLSNAQLSGGVKTMEEFLDRLLHVSIYDKRIRPFFMDVRGSLLDKSWAWVFRNKWCFYSFKIINPLLLK
jgi:hypothetical protein